jgi:Haloacid dehalogenase-like hydrolase
MGQLSQPGPGRGPAGAGGRGDGHRADAGPLPRRGPAHAGCGRGGEAAVRALAAALSTEQVSRGKPAPDIYLAVTDLLGFVPEACAAVEDSTNGLRSAAAAGLQVIAVPHPRYPPEPAALDAARLVLTGPDELTVQAVAEL